MITKFHINATHLFTDIHQISFTLYLLAHVQSNNQNQNNSSKPKKKLLSFLLIFKNLILPEQVYQAYEGN